MKRKSTAISLAAVLIATPALAQQTYVYSDYDTDATPGLTDTEFGTYSADVFGRYDTDRDMMLSEEEYGLFNNEVGPFDEPFEAWDREPDGFLTEDEFGTGLYGAYDTNNDLLIDEPEFGAYGMNEQVGDTVGGPDNTVQTNQIVRLSDWRYDDLYGPGVSVEELMDDMDVYGPTGEEIGEVDDVLFGSNGQALAIIAEIGGFWDIGDTHVSIPWEMVEVNLDNVIVPVTEDTVGDYSLFAQDYITADGVAQNIQQVDGGWFDDSETGPYVWRASELIGEYARLAPEGTTVAENYGYVNDLIIVDGTLRATVVSPDVGWGTGGYYAYPYTGYRRGADYYDIPYNETEARGLEPFEYNRLGMLD